MQISNYWGQLSKRSFFGVFSICLFQRAGGENKATKKRFKNCLKMLCRLQQPVRERSAGAFPEKWLVIEPKYILPANSAVPRRSSPTGTDEFREMSLATGGERRRLYISRLIKSNFGGLFFISNQYSQYIFPVRTGDARKITKFIVTNILFNFWRQMMETPWISRKASL